MVPAYSHTWSGTQHRRGCKCLGTRYLVYASLGTEAYSNIHVYQSHLHTKVAEDEGTITAWSVQLHFALFP